MIEACAKFRMETVVRHAALLAALFLIANGFASAQIAEEFPDVPPPMRVANKEEREKLAAAPDPKNRVKLILEFMENRVRLAEAALARGDYSEVHRELGGFHFFLDDGLRFLIRNDTGSNSSGNNFKRFEIALRAFAPRLELLRREVPTNYEPYVLTILKRLREARTRAVEPLFGSN